MDSYSQQRSQEGDGMQTRGSDGRRHRSGGGVLACLLALAVLVGTACSDPGAAESGAKSASEILPELERVLDISHADSTSFLHDAQVAGFLSASDVLSSVERSLPVDSHVETGLEPLIVSIQKRVPITPDQVKEAVISVACEQVVAMASGSPLPGTGDVARDLAMKLVGDASQWFAYAFDAKGLIDDVASLLSSNASSQHIRLLIWKYQHC